MKNITLRTGIYKWCITMLVVLLPVLSKAQNDILVSYDFASNCAAPPAGWSIQNVDGGCTWRCSGGIIQNNHSSQGCSGAANDWLITPQLDFDAFINEYIDFAFGFSYSGGGLYVKFSSNYPGTGNPDSYTWTTIASYNGGGGGILNINNYSGKGYIAFQYVSTGNGNGQAALYNISAISVKGTKALYVNNPTATNLGTTTARLGANVVNANGSTITGRGIVWSTSPNPLRGGSGVTELPVSGTEGVFDTTVSGLAPGTRIYYKGFVSDPLKTVYTSEAIFYTLSTEPPAYPTSFTATTVSKNSIRLDWTQVSGAEGYLLIQRVANAPTGTPQDATRYNSAQVFGDGVVAGVITSGGTTTATINGLIQGTRYYYTLFPYNYNLVNTETYNYHTQAPVPTATDSTWGSAPSFLSVLDMIDGSGDTTIPSIINDATVNDTTKGALTWRLRLKDGGVSMNDPDDLPTIVTSITLRMGPKNTVTNWAASILSAGLFDDSTGALIKAGTITASSLVFSGLNIIAADNNYRPLSVRISLRQVAHTDKSRFHFRVDSADVIPKTVYESSQTQSFSVLSDTLKNRIEVKAIKLVMAATLPSLIEAGAFVAQQQLSATDTYGAVDLDFNEPVTIVSAAGNLIAGPRVISAANGIALFDTVRFRSATPADTLIASATGLTTARSIRFAVENSRKSDIVADAGFVYPRNIRHLDYNSQDTIHSGNSVEVFGLYLRDGGSGGDNDFEPTILSQLTMTVGNFAIVRRMALYANGNKVSEIQNVTASSVFADLNIVAADNDSLKLSIRVTFKDQVQDNQRLTFTITGTAVAAGSSFFAVANAGGAFSSQVQDDNKVNITASRLVFVTQPVNVARGSVMYPYVTVQATDDAGNVDASGRAITIESVGSPLNFSSEGTEAVIPTKGLAEFDKLIFNVPATGVTLIARATGLDSTVSNVFSVLLPTWFRSVKSGKWTDLSTWEYSTDFGDTWVASTLVPDYSIHGYITIRTGDTVQMDGTTTAANTVDEVTVESGAVLITPTGPSYKLTVNDALGDDILVAGKLLINNSQSPGGPGITDPASIRVVKGGIIELASFGNAADWAGNDRIWFEDSAIYLHNTVAPNTINAVTMFPNADVSSVAIFRIGQDYTYPGTFVNAGSPLIINGLLSIDTGKIFNIGGSGERHLRNGLTGAGDLNLRETSKTRITDAAQLSGSGKIIITGSSALFQVAAGSYTELLNNKEIRATNNAVNVSGVLNGLTNGFSGSAGTLIAPGATLITAHNQGLDGLFANTGTKNANASAQYVFNGNAPQNSGAITGNTAATVRVSNPSGVTLTSDVTVTDTLFLGNGLLHTSATALLTVTGNIDAYSATSYISGPLKGWVDSAETRHFPVGKSGYGPVSYTSLTDSWVTLEYVNTNPDADGYDTSRFTGSISAVKAGEYWKLNTSNASGGSIEIPYTANSAVSAADTQNIRVVSWNGSSWISEGPVRRTASATRVTSDILNNYTVFTIGIDSACSIPASPSFSALNVCLGNTANLTAAGNGNIRWFAAMNDPAPFATGNTVNAGIIFTDTVFYTEVQNKGCYSQRVAYPVTINAIPQPAIVTGNTQLCYNEVLQLSADTAGTHHWYSDISSSLPVFTGDLFVSAPLTGDTSFYVEKVENACAATRVRVDISVRSLISAPFSIGAEICAGNPATIKATANEEIRWFSGPLSTTSFFTGEKYISSVLSADTTYYLEAFEANCRSSRVPVQVDVLALPSAPVLSQPSVCEGSSAEITATASGDVYWYIDPNTNIAADTGFVFQTGSLNTSRIYYARVFDNKCWSNRVSSAVSVYPVPVGAAFTVASGIPANQSTLVQTTTTAQYYEWDFGTGAEPQTAAGIGPHQVKWMSRGTKTITMKVWNGNTSVACSTEVQKQVEVGPGLGIDGVESVQVRVYPNPVNGGILNIHTGDPVNAVITVLDATGRMVWNGTASAAETTIAVQDWAAGVYFVNVKTGSYNHTVKVIR